MPKHIKRIPEKQQINFKDEIDYVKNEMSEISKKQNEITGFSKLYKSNKTGFFDIPENNKIIKITVIGSDGGGIGFAKGSNVTAYVELLEQDFPHSVFFTIGTSGISTSEFSTNQIVSKKTGTSGGNTVVDGGEKYHIIAYGGEGGIDSSEICAEGGKFEVTGGNVISYFGQNGQDGNIDNKLQNSSGLILIEYN